MSETLTSPVSAPAQPRQLRLWPAVGLILALWALIKVPGWIAPGSLTHFMFTFYSPLLITLGLLGWWLFASRLRWSDRLLGLFTFLVGGVAAIFLCDHSFRIPLILYGLPTVTTAWVGWLVFSVWLSWPARRIGLMLAILLAWGSCTLWRFEGVFGNMEAQVTWRFTPTAEEEYLKSVRNEQMAEVSDEPLKLVPGDWPGFRGPNRDGRLTGVRIATDWEKNPPKQLWKHAIGPGWSSFAVIGDRVFTQEQRGPAEAVLCLDANTGQTVWVHSDETRFYEAVAGPGPRATPTYHEGKLYTLGANGTLNCLDAATGKPVWVRNVVDDSGASVPQWGFSASPLVAQGIVSVFAGGPNDKAVLGYDARSGDLAWSAGSGKHSYCSTQLSTLDGVEQILVSTDLGMLSLDPKSGKVFWNYEWISMQDMARVVQPTVVSETDVLLGTGFQLGMRRLRASFGSLPGTVEEVWSSRAISPYYNDSVVYQGHLYGFDNDFFTCVNLDEGEKRWRARGYGHGQVLLLADQGLLVVQAEKGDVVLLEANPEKRIVLGRIKALQGKTWNHPVIAHGKLFVRNGEEVACFEVKPESSNPAK